MEQLPSPHSPHSPQGPQGPHFKPTVEKAGLSSKKVTASDHKQTISKKMEREMSTPKKESSTPVSGEKRVLVRANAYQIKPKALKNSAPYVMKSVNVYNSVVLNAFRGNYSVEIRGANLTNSKGAAPAVKQGDAARDEAILKEAIKEVRKNFDGADFDKLYKAGNKAMTKLVDNKVKEISGDFKFEPAGGRTKSETKPEPPARQKVLKQGGLHAVPGDDDNKAKEPAEGDTKSETKHELPPDVKKNLSPVQQEVLRQAELNAVFRHDENKTKALTRIGKNLNIPEGEREAALTKIMDFIGSSKPTLNFNGQDMGKLGRMEEKGGLEKLWDAPAGFFEEGLVQKRQNVEKSMHGYADSPSTKDFNKEDRPVYMSLNVGGAVRGAAPYYGNCYLVGKDHVLDKSTIASSDTFSQSFADDGSRVANRNHLESIVATMDEDALKQVYDMATGNKPPTSLPMGRYLEAQVTNLDWKDIDKVVLDRRDVAPGSEAETRWKKLAEENGFKIEVFDSKEWETNIKSDGLKSANENCKPVSVKTEKEGAFNITKDNIDTFMKNMKLERIDKIDDAGKKIQVSMGLQGLRDITNAFGKSVSAEDYTPPNPPPEIKQDTPLGRLLHASQPYATHYDSITKFTAKNEAAFKKFKENLPTEKDVQKAKENLDSFTKELGTQEMTEKNKVKLAKLKLNYEDARNGHDLKVNLGPADSALTNLTNTPIEHVVRYVQLIGDFRNNLDKGKIADMKNNTTALADFERDYLNTLDLLEKVVKNPQFQKMCSDPELAKSMGKMLESMAGAAVGTVKDFHEFENSVHADPQGWVNKAGFPKTQ